MWVWFSRLRVLFGAGENGLSGSKFFRKSHINFLQTIQKKPKSNAVSVLFPF